MTTKSHSEPCTPKDDVQPQDAGPDAPAGDLPGLHEHNAQVLAGRPSKVLDSILPRSPTEDELRGSR